MGKQKFPKYPYVGSLVPNISGDDTDEANFPDIWDQICPLWAGPKESRFSDDFFLDQKTCLRTQSGPNLLEIYNFEGF